METENKQYRSLAIKKHIESMADVYEFFDDLQREDLLIHPDDLFADIAEKENISAEMAARLDDTMERCVEMCEKIGEDIYEAILPYFRDSLNKLRRPEKPEESSNLYIILSTDGATYSPDGDYVDNCQMLGIAGGTTREEAVESLFHDQPELKRMGFSPEETTAYKIVK